MSKRLVLLGGLGVVALSAVLGATWLLSLPAGASKGGAPSIAQSEIDSMLAAQQVLAIEATPPARVLDDTLRAIAARYGTRTADVVAMQLEYPRR